MSTKEISLRNKELHVYDSTIVHMTFSQSEERVGVCNTDYTMSFWDTSDNFNFEKTILNKTTNLHTQIYYINY